MSGFLGAQSMLDPQTLMASDERVCAATPGGLVGWAAGYRREQIAPWQDGVLWPSARMVGSDQTQALLGLDAQTSGRWASSEVEGSGGRQGVFLRGITRDSTGAPLAGCQVAGFVTATQTYVGTVTSDQGGYFALSTPYPGQAHYLVSTRAGSPNVLGVSDNTLIPS